MESKKHPVFFDTGCFLLYVAEEKFTTWHAARIRTTAPNKMRYTANGSMGFFAGKK